MVDNKDLKDENVDVNNGADAEATEESTESVAESTESVAESTASEESSEDTTNDQDATQTGDTTQDGITAAEEASREGFSSGQATVENFVAASTHSETNMDADQNSNPASENDPSEGEVDGMAAFFDRPDELMQAAAFTRLAKYTKYDAFSPFPIHGMDHAMGLGPSWIPWVTFGAGTGGFLLANALQFGMMTFDWPMIIGGKSFAPWPAFIPIMFELTVLLAGVTTVIVMLIAAGCFRKPRIIDPDITNDRFVLWISAEDETFDFEQVKAFMESLDPVEVRTITKGA